MTGDTIVHAWTVRRELGLSPASRPSKRKLRSLLANNETGDELDWQLRELDTRDRGSIADGVKSGDPRLAGQLQLRSAKKALKQGRQGLVWRKTNTAHVLVRLAEPRELIVTVRGAGRILFPEKLSSSVVRRNYCGSDGAVTAVNEAFNLSLVPARVIPIVEDGGHHRFLISAEFPAINKSENRKLPYIVRELARTPGCRPGDDDAVVAYCCPSRASLFIYAVGESVELFVEFLDLCITIERLSGMPFFNAIVLDDRSSLSMVNLTGAEEKRARAEIGRQRARRQKAYELLARGMSGHALDEALSVIERDAWEVQPWSAFCDRLAEDLGAFAADFASLLDNPLIRNSLVFD